MQFDSKLKIGAIIKDFRKRNGYTQEQLAELIEVTPGFLGQVERDETYPNIENLNRIINILNIDANYIFYKHKIPDSESELILNEINIVLKNCFLQDLFGQSCKTFLDIVACPNWTKLQSAG